MKSPKISIITICYNAEKIIEYTIRSVIDQTYKNIEYVVVDGNSTDKTLDIIRKYQECIDIFVSEPDDGIYDAMNKGICLCSGDFCIFMNAGDKFYSNTSVQDAVSQMNVKNHVIYGNTEYIYNSGTVIRSPKPLSYVKKGAFCCHQSAMFQRQVLNENNFDTSYRIVADWALFKKLYENGYKFQYIDVIVATFDNTAGASSSNDVKSYIKHQKEKLICKNQYDLMHCISLYVSAVWFYIRRNIFIPLLPNIIFRHLKNYWIKINS